MWAVIKFDKNNIQLLKKDLTKKLGDDLNIYSPKIHVQKYKKNKLVSKEFALLGDYLFCFHSKFKDPDIINSLKFSRGLKYFLSGFSQSQEEINNFILKCKSSENNEGYLTKNFLELYLNSKYKFCNGPFANMIFKIIEIQKNKINILVGNIKTTIKKDEFLFNPL